MSVTTERAVRIDDDATRIIEAAEVVRFAADLVRALEFAELETMRVRRLRDASDSGELRDDYLYPLENVAALALVAETVEHELDRAREWVHELRTECAYLFHVTNTTAPNYGPEQPEREAAEAARRYLDSRDEVEEDTDAR